MTARVIYYYQTFNGLDKLLPHIEDVDVIIVASIHFGLTDRNAPYIHLNNNEPTDNCFTTLWEQAEWCSTHNTDILLLIGGAGGAFTTLFQAYQTYYPLLVTLLRAKKNISGVELDIEESVDLTNVQMFIRDLVRDFGPSFIITMSPVADSMIGNGRGMGDFSYKELVNSPEGDHIKWFNVQSYGMFTEATYAGIIKNGYNPAQIVLGMLSSDFDTQTFDAALLTIKNIKERWPTMGGVDVWEYYAAPPDIQDPSQWAKLVAAVLRETPSTHSCILN